MGYGSHYCLMQQFDSDAAADKTKQKKTNKHEHLFKNIDASRKEVKFVKWKTFKFIV